MKYIFKDNVTLLMKFTKLLALGILFLLLAPAVQAQKGHYLSLWGGPQLTYIANYDDYNSFQAKELLDKESTYRIGGGLRYTWNFADFYGFQTGVYYSRQGQKYSGTIDFDYNTLQNVPTDSQFFTSHVYLNYVRIPLLFRFNSQADNQDKITMSLYMGIQLGFLTQVQEVVTDPAPPDTMVAKYPNFDFNKLYKKFDPGLCAGAEFNIKISDKLGTMIGARFDRSLSNIENLDTKLPDGAPVEWDFPVSTRKRALEDRLVRQPSKNGTVNIYTGLTFRLSGDGD